MPAPTTARSLFIRGLLILAAGVLLRIFMGTVLEAYEDYVGPGASLEFSSLTTLMVTIDSILIPLGVGLVVGSYIVSSLTGSTREGEQASPIEDSSGRSDD